MKTEAGKLATHIPEAKKYEITELKVTGEINGTDILLLRQMAGKGLKEDDRTEGKLTSLDLSGVRIVEEGENYCAIKQGLLTKFYKPTEKDAILFHRPTSCLYRIEIFSHLDYIFA